MQEPRTPLVADSHGLICAFELGPLAPLDIGALEDPGAHPSLWLHFNLADRRAEEWVRNQAWLPEPAREMLLEAEPHAHLQILAEGFVVVLRDLNHGFDGDEAGFATLVAYVDPRRMLTGRRHPLRTLNHLRRELAAGRDFDSTMALFEHLLECMTDTIEALVAKQARIVEEAEDAILAGRFKDRGAELRRVRWLLARIRREARANRTALGRLPAHLPQILGTESRHALGQSIERFASVGQDLEFVEDRARLMQEEIAQRLSEATNRNLYLLSTVTTTLLPITLLTGIFGMNVGGLPWLTSSNGFWHVMALMAAAVMAALALISRTRMM